MINKRTILSIIGILILSTLSVYSQTFPVSVSTNITPPYSTFLGDYVAPGSERLAVNIFLNDINRPELQTRLRLRIEGQGILIETKPEFLPAPLILQGGVPERLIASDLAQYFLPQNLNFSGLSRQQFERSGQLPEGLYQICFEVVEYNRGVKVSNSGCTMAWLILNDPPLINLPRQEEKLKPQEPQYVTFQWTPRHTGSPNSAFSTEYEFTLVELWPANRNPNDAILTSPPIYQTTTQSTTLIYGPAETPLEPGRRYAFQVRAKSMTGIDELDLFKNQGRSQVHSFQYGDACNIPANISAKASNSGAFKVIYEPNINHTAFSIRYRKANDPQATWYEEDSYFEEIEVNGLQPETTYEYQLTAGCGPFGSEYSPVAMVTTDEMPEVLYACGLPPEDFDFGNNEPLPSLKRDDILYAGDFNVKISEATGAAGNFTGKGTVVVPYLDNLAVSVEFSSIVVNTDYRMTAGSMDVKGIGVDVLPDDVSDFIDELDETLASVDETLQDVSEGLDVAEEIIDIIEEETGNTEESDDGETTDDSSPEGTENGNTDNTNNSGNENEGEGETNNDEENGDSSDPDNSEGNESSNGNNNSDGDTSDSTTYDVKIWFNEDNREYADGETINIDFTSDKRDIVFRLKNYPESIEQFKWRFMHNNVDHTVDVQNIENNLDNFGLNIGSKAGDIKLIAEYDGKPIELIINVVRKEFELKSITAVDGENNKRKAHWGEKLYLVNGTVDLGGITASKREINYEAKITPDLDFKEFSIGDLVYSFEDQETNNLEQEFGVKTITRTVEEEEDIIRTKVKAGYPAEKEMYVDVQWVDQDLNVVSYANKINQLMKVFELVNDVSDKMATVAPCQITILQDLNRNIKFQWSNYNIEDRYSRQAHKVAKFEFIGSVGNLVKLKCGKKLAISVFGYGLDLGEIYAQLSAGLNASIVNADYFLCEDDSFLESKTYGTGGLLVAGEVGLTIGGGLKNDDGTLMVGLVGGGRVFITGGGRLEYPYQGNNNVVGVVFFINPLQYAFTAEAKMGSLSKIFEYKSTLIDMKLEKEITIQLNK